MATNDSHQPAAMLISNMLHRDLGPHPQEVPGLENVPTPQALSHDEALESALRELRSMGVPEEILHRVRPPREFVNMPPPLPRGGVGPSTGAPGTNEPHPPYPLSLISNIDHNANVTSASPGVLASFEALLGLGELPDASGPAMLLTTVLMDLQQRVGTCDARESVVEQQVAAQVQAVAAIRRLIRGIILQWRDLVVRMQGAVADHDAALKAAEARVQLAESRANAAEATARKAESEAALAVKEISSLRGSLVQLVRVVEGQETARRRLEDEMRLAGVLERSGKSPQLGANASEGQKQEELLDGYDNRGHDSDTV